MLTNLAVGLLGTLLDVRKSAPGASENSHVGFLGDRSGRSPAHLRAAPCPSLENVMGGRAVCYSDQDTQCGSQSPYH